MGLMLAYAGTWIPRWLTRIGPEYLLIILLAIAFTPYSTEAKHAHPERHYQESWCTTHRGRSEVRLPDGARVDCVTDTHAIEFDFGPKWTEAIGQALYYSLHTGKKAGIVLIIESETDLKYWIRLNTVIEHYRLLIDVWKVTNSQAVAESPRQRSLCGEQ